PPWTAHCGAGGEDSICSVATCCCCCCRIYMGKHIYNIYIHGYAYLDRTILLLLAPKMYY
uniref:Uncharacterized protein n=1 Tax=Oryza brachyantha TaxID=4533 RepID=J3MKZ6_ORYBR